MNDWYTNAVIYFTDYSLSFDIWYLLRLCPHLKLYPSSFSFSSIQFFLSSHRLLIPLGTLCIVISSILTYSLCLIYWTIEYKFMQLHFFSIRISQLAFYPDLLQQLFCGWLFYISIPSRVVSSLTRSPESMPKHMKGHFVFESVRTNNWIWYRIVNTPVTLMI